MRQVALQPFPARSARLVAVMWEVVSVGLRRLVKRQVQAQPERDAHDILVACLGVHDVDVLGLQGMDQSAQVVTRTHCAEHKWSAEIKVRSEAGSDGSNLGQSLFT